MSWDCQCRSSKPATCQLFTQPATYLLNLPTYFPTCKLFSQTCQLFPQPANFLPKPANFFPNLPTFSLNLPTFSQTCQLLSHDLGGDPPPPDGHLSQPCILFLVGINETLPRYRRLIINFTNTKFEEQVSQWSSHNDTPNNFYYS